MGEAEMKQIAAWMDRVVSNPDEATATAVAGEVRELTRKFPAPGISG
jgi:glycine/serine hydroxymethyltransferase